MDNIAHEDGMPVVVQATGTLQGAMDGIRVPANQFEMLKGVVIAQVGKYSYVVQSMRPWREFLILAKPPSGMDVMVKKIHHNVRYFQANYLLVTMGFLAFSVLTSPSCLILFSIMAAGWLYLLKLNEDPNYMLVIAGIPLGKPQRNIAAGILSMILILIFAGSLILSVIAMSAVAVGAHALLNGTTEVSAIDNSVAEDDPINQI